MTIRRVYCEETTTVYERTASQIAWGQLVNPPKNSFINYIIFPMKPP